MILLSVDNVSKQFGGTESGKLFDSISFEIQDKDKVGLVGDNGCGKTTLLRIITGETEPDSGGTARAKNLTVGTMDQHVCTDSQRSMWDEVELVFAAVIEVSAQLDEVNSLLNGEKMGDIALIERQLELNEKFHDMGGLTYQSRIRSTLIGLGFSEDAFSQRMGTLSGGQQAKVAIARLLLAPADLLLLDEPTNHLDIDSVGWLEEFLAGYEGAVLIISHDRYFLDKVTNKTFEIANKRLYSSGGNYSYHKQMREKNREVEEKHYKNISKDIKRVEESIAKLRQFNREKSIRAAESKEKMLDKMKANVVIPEKDSLTIGFKFNPRLNSGNEVLFAENLSKSFGSNHLFRKVNLDIRKRDRVFILGPNGCGKTTLLKILKGDLEADSGEIEYGTKVSVGYYDQVQSGLNLEKTAIDEVWDSFTDKTQTEIRNAMAAFLFRADDVFKQVKNLSGGERARVLLLKLMLAGDNLLLLDEPTNHLDISSREALEDALAGYEGTLMIVSHDRYFINKMANKVVTISLEGAKQYVGNYDDYIYALAPGQAEVYETGSEKPKPSFNQAKVADDAKASENSYEKRKQSAAWERKLRADIRKNEALASSLEEEIDSLNETLLDEDVSSNYEKTIEITTLLDQKNDQLNNLLELWEELHTKAEEFGIEI